MMKILKRMLSLLCVVIVSMPAHAAPTQFKTDASALSAQERELFSDVEKVLNDWTGENEKLVSAQVMIDSFIKSDPDFLPIYIEKARLTIMRGATGTNDYEKANRDALKMLADVQQKDPAYAKSYVLAGHAFLNIGDFENSRKSLDRAERIGTTDPWLYYNRADLLGRQKQYDKALDYARKALAASNDNSKALVSAIYFIGKYSKFSEQATRSADIPLLVFESFKEPDQRMRIATRLIDGYGGDSNILDYAYKIIDRQSQETPHRESVDLAMAEWFLKKGYLKNRNEVAIYDPQFSAIAEKILATIEPTTTAASRVFSDRFDIALSNNEIVKAHELQYIAESNGVPQGKLMASRALMAAAQGDYQSVVRILEKLAESDPDFGDEHLLVAAYAHLGRSDLLAAYYKRLVDRYPSSAWNLGNYAGFLLFTMHDIDGAIHYGDEALKQMDYSIARNTTSLAYLMKASTLKRAGKESEARSLVKRASSIGFDQGYVNTYCQDYCADIRALLNPL